MDYKMPLAIAAALFVLFSAMLSPLFAASVALGILVVLCSYFLIARARRLKRV